MSLALRMQGGAPAGFVPRLREIAAAVDPTLRLNEVLSLDRFLRQLQGILRLVALAMTLVTLSVLLLSAAGNYALMSFTVARRRKEIGIRAALGVRPHHLLASIFSRALGQLAIGIAIGIGAAALLNNFTGGNLMGGEGAVVLPGVAALMMVVGILAVLVPARRGLRIHPTEALRAE